MAKPPAFTPHILAALLARGLQARVFRMIRQELRDRILSPEGSVLHGGRYNPKGVFGALYCGDTEEVCRAEVAKAAAHLPLAAFVVGTIQVQLQKVLDLTDDQVLMTLGLTRADLTKAGDWRLTQHLGALAREAGFEALLVPSAAGPGTNLVIFSDRLLPGSSIELVKEKPASNPS